MKLFKIIRNIFKSKITKSIEHIQKEIAMLDYILQVLTTDELRYQHADSSLGACVIISKRVFGEYDGFRLKTYMTTEYPLLLHYLEVPEGYCYKWSNDIDRIEGLKEIRCHLELMLKHLKYVK